MQLDIAPTPSSDPATLDETASEQIDAPDLRLFVFALFFIFGGITSLNDVVIPKLKALFTLSYAEAMLVQSAFFAAYLLISLPAAAIVRRVGYLRSAAIGLVTMALGCLLFVPASSFGVFATFLLAIFVLASGITIVQVVANPLISMLGPPATAHSRLTFAQAFNSLGTTIFPYVGSILILKSLKEHDPATLTGAALNAFRVRESQVIVQTYIGLAIALLVVAWVVWARRDRLQAHRIAETPILHAFGLLRQPRFGFGALGIFLYVGAEVAIGSVIVNFLMQPDVLGLSARAAGERVPFYWGGAMIGRFIGAYLLRIYSPGKCLRVPPLSRSCSWPLRAPAPVRSPAGRCSRLASSTRSCFRQFSRSRRKASAAAHTRAPVLSALRSSGAPSYRSLWDTRRMPRVSG